MGFLILRPEDEPPDPCIQESDPGAVADRRPQPPRAPILPTLSYDHGIIGRPGTQSAPLPYGERRTYPGPDQGGYELSDPYGAQARIREDGQRFRPLAGQEQGHGQVPTPGQRTGRYAAPYEPSLQPYPPSLQSRPLRAQPQPTAPAPYPSPPAYTDPAQENYDFRPLEKSPAARGRWQGPYGQPNQHRDRPSIDPWSPSPYPQWGSPSSQRAYKN